MRCDGTTKNGTPCRAQAVARGSKFAKHSADPAITAASREAARRGGQARARQLAVLSANPLPPLGVADLKLESLAGLKTYLARSLMRLGELPFDVRVANSIAQLVNVQPSALEASELEERVERLEVTFVDDVWRGEKRLTPG